jgi:hypothetical protein
MHGRQVIKKICRENGLKFRTTEPVQERPWGVLTT